MSKTIHDKTEGGTNMTQEVFDKAKQCLIDNGIEADEAEVVLQALCYILLDEETEQFFEEATSNGGN